MINILCVMNEGEKPELFCFRDKKSAIDYAIEHYFQDVDEDDECDKNYLDNVKSSLKKDNKYNEEDLSIEIVETELQ